MSDWLRRPVVYSIDADDVIRSVNRAWADFAVENGAPQLAESVVGTSLWRHITGGAVIDLSHAILAHVRKTQTVATYHFRCDSPETRRDMELTLRPLPKNGIECESTVLCATPRARIPLFDGSIPHSDELITMCAWCRKVRAPDWVEADVAASRRGWFKTESPPSISHSICPECSEYVLQQIRPDHRPHTHHAISPHH